MPCYCLMMWEGRGRMDWANSGQPCLHVRTFTKPQLKGGVRMPHCNALYSYPCCVHFDWRWPPGHLHTIPFFNWQNSQQLNFRDIFAILISSHHVIGKSSKSIDLDRGVTLRFRLSRRRSKAMKSPLPLVVTCSYWCAFQMRLRGAFFTITVRPKDI